MYASTTNKYCQQHHFIVQLRHPPHHLATRHADLNHRGALMHHRGLHAFSLAPSNSTTIAQKLAQLQHDPSVLHVELDRTIPLSSSQVLPDDPQLPLQYGLVNVRAPWAWANITGNRSVRVCVLDTGASRHHRCDVAVFFF